MSNCNPAFAPEAFEVIPGLRMLHIPAGRFQMGSPPKEEGRDTNEGPQHEVTLQDFWLGQTPITQAQWREVAGWVEGPGERWGQDLSGKLEPSRFRGDNRPVENVSWLDAMEFCSRLSQRTGRLYTLPSEAQWEYACRAGTTTPFAFGETLTPELANYDGRYTYANGPKGEYREQTTPVGMFPANAWGLHDMHGNVWEWCLDDWHDSYNGAPADDSAWFQRFSPKLLRGGSWFIDPHSCRSAARDSSSPGVLSGYVGFRVCCRSEVNCLSPDQQLQAGGWLPIDKAPQDGRVCLIGGPRPNQGPEYRAWAWFDENQNAWREVGSNGITFHYNAVKWYYPDPFGIQPATE